MTKHNLLRMDNVGIVVESLDETSSSRERLARAHLEIKNRLTDFEN
jgi:hypothetical protein